MFRSVHDSVAFRRMFTRQVIAPIGAVIVATIILAALGLYWATDRSDDLAVERQSKMTERALRASVEQLSYEQHSDAQWAALVRRLAQPVLDLEWIDRNVGTWLHEMFGHDWVFILDSSSRPVYGSIEGKQVEPARFEDVRSNVQVLIDGARRDRDNSDGVSADVANVENRPAAASIAKIELEGADMIFSPAPFLMVNLRFLDGPYLKHLADENLIEGLRYSQSPAVLEGEVSVRLKNRTGSDVGYFAWRPDLPGTKVLRLLAPITAAIVLNLVLVMLRLATSLWRSGRQLGKTLLELKASEAQAQHMAFHDVLTGLPNRALLADHIDHALVESRRKNMVAVLMLDLDRFKRINDLLGHAAGDSLIRQLAERLSSAIREADTVARIGGDEFTILQASVVNRQDVEALCQRILDVVAAPFDLIGNEVAVGISIGVALAPDHTNDRVDLMRKADIALYRAKTEGRNRYRFFEAVMDETVRIRAQIEEELRQALREKDQIRVYYQPEMAPDGERIVGLEALVRWQHPVRRMVAPDQFIPIAEETGLIHPLGEYILTEALQTAKRWPDVFMAVNLSAAQFCAENFATRVVDLAKQEGCKAEQIELEVTESLLMQDDDRCREALATLRRAGFRIALDDFGTGYSSLSYLRKFKVDKIKIDRSFIQTLDSSDETTAIVTSVVNLGHAMGLTVTAEGVETREQMRLLSDIGCNELQGFLFSRAIPGSALATLFRDAQACLRTKSGHM